MAKGYGFTLANNKLTKLPEIGKVDPGSPAAAAGLKPKDIIIEINGHNVLEESHNQRVSFFLLAVHSLEIIPHVSVFKISLLDWLYKIGGWRHKH